MTFERFREIMGEVDAMIGRNSYFSQEMLALYYGGNDMEKVRLRSGSTGNSMKETM